jgi:hypothetical protein
MLNLISSLPNSERILSFRASCRNPAGLHVRPCGLHPIKLVAPDKLGLFYPRVLQGIHSLLTLLRSWKRDGRVSLAREPG